MNYLAIPVSNVDSSSVSISPVECVPNLALVYLRTMLGPQGPKPLPNIYKKNIKQRKLNKIKCSTWQKLMVCWY